MHQLIGIRQQIGPNRQVLQLPFRLDRDNSQPLSPPLDLDGPTGRENLVQNPIDVGPELRRRQAHNIRRLAETETYVKIRQERTSRPQPSLDRRRPPDSIEDRPRVE